ncbi:restriction endonuclease subunit S [Shewanella baltica]|uniref:restriction endonuclease subunit S n=1 Tax=Shewanella baltica TaxID=62322 RepID=UPI00217E46F5|nr:restriction endonuclease subunit S [Shewanella baltica]MCS6123379.1 restriction endonuclease subunit S [Shewanella baltica]
MASSYTSKPLSTLVDVMHQGINTAADKVEYEAKGTAIIQSRNFTSGNLDLNDVKYLGQADSYKYGAKYTPIAGDILFSNIGTVGRSVIVASERNFVFAWNVFLIRVNHTKIDKTYLKFYLDYLHDIGVYESWFTGGTVKFLNKKTIGSIEIPLPPLETQKQIAAVLEKADQLRKDCLQMEQELNSLAQSVFIEMFGDPLINPKGWRVRTLNEFYASAKTGTKCGPFGSALKKDEFVDSGVPVWNMSNISLTGEFIDSPSLWITEKKYQNLEAYNVLQGDVIISRAGTVGKMGVVLSKYDRSIISTNLIRVRFGEDLLPLYFVCLMTYCKTRLKRLKVGDDGSFSHMNTGILDNLEFPYPPMNEQLKYMKFREELDAQINCLKQLKIEQELNFSSLMQKAFNGELNLDNAKTQ